LTQLSLFLINKKGKCNPTGSHEGTEWGAEL